MAGRGKTMLRRLLRFTRWIPASSKLLYPFWLSEQLDVVEDETLFGKLPESFDGLVIAYASDIHFGPFLDRNRAEDLARRLNAMQADIILLGGDYGETTLTAIEFFNILPPLAAKLGVYAVIGNHDLLGSQEEISKLKALLRLRGYALLDNSTQILHRDGASLCLCATDDILEGEPDVAALIKDIQASDFVLFAPHSPDILPEAEKEPGFRFDLALCGHTHGGQLVVFGRSLHSSSRYGDKYARGWMDVHGGRLMVSHGVGTSLLPMRLGVRPQIHRIVLRKNN